VRVRVKDIGHNIDDPSVYFSGRVESAVSRRELSSDLGKSHLSKLLQSIKVVGVPSSRKRCRMNVNGHLQVSLGSLVKLFVRQSPERDRCTIIDERLGRQGVNSLPGNGGTDNLNPRSRQGNSVDLFDQACM
jgi:hypothetical protein